VIAGEIQRNRRIKLIVFSRRFGQPRATMAGIALARGDATCVIDIDLQDPPELIAELHAKLSEGFDVVSEGNMNGSRTPVALPWFRHRDMAPNTRTRRSGTPGSPTPQPAVAGSSSTRFSISSARDPSRRSPAAAGTARTRSS
jgi:glycosyltransferase involved in cell wall biosynthesis